MNGLAQRSRRRRLRRVTLACAAAIVLGVSGVWWQERSSGLPLASDSVVVVDAPRRQMLADGSVAELAPGAEIEMAFGDRYRLVTLRRGRAHFEVAPNPQRPFVVRVGDIAVRAVGTAFAIDCQPESLSVLVTHGQVALDPASAFSNPTAPAQADAPLALMPAGTFTRVESAVAPRVVAPIVRQASESDVESAVGWRAPRLEFSGTPLAEVVATMNRYNRVHFVLEDATLAPLRLSGVLRADKVEALIAILETDFPIRVERRGGEVMALHRRDARP